MPSVSITKPKLSLVFLVLLVSFQTSAQENSPFSRFGLGNTLPSRNVVNMAMGGISAAYVPFVTSQSINFNNPASYSSIRPYVIYDLGISLTNRTLKSNTPTGKYNSVDLVPSYVTLGIPLDTARHMGLVFGLRPLTRISYSSQETKVITGTGGTKDSVLYVYEGDGGLYQAFAGIGKRWGNFSLGINTGYNFGKRANNTTTVVRDTVTTFNSHSRTSTSFSHLFLSGGLQYEANLSKTTVLRFGVAGNLKQKLNGRQDVLRETFSFLGNGSTTPIDTISSIVDKAGTIEMPLNYNAGISIVKSVQANGRGRPVEKGFLSLEYESTRWSDFRFYNEAESLVNSWQFKVGGQFVPNPLNFRSFWNLVAFRGGFYFGRDAVLVSGKEMPVLGVSLGAGFPVRKWRSFDNQFTNINTAFEFGKRGNNNNNITESFFRFSVGFSLSDIWFIKRRYD
jgi:hypothetical protein